VAHVWYHCGGAGEIDGTRNVDLPYYPGGIVTFAWAPPHDMPAAKAEKVDRKLSALHDKMIDLIAEATGLPAVNDYERHEIPD
jgi:hypothetical protein